MVRNKLCCNANDAVGLPKQRNSYQSSSTFLCFESPTAIFAFQHNLFRTMWPDPAKGLLSLESCESWAISLYKKIQKILWLQATRVKTHHNGINSYCQIYSANFHSQTVSWQKILPRYLSYLTLSNWCREEKFIDLPTKANFEKRAEIPATTSGHLWSRVTAVNISRVTVNCFLFDVIVFWQCCLSWHLTGKSFIVSCHVIMII